MSYSSIKPGIYIIRNILSNKVYIGSSLNPRARIKEHFNSLNKNIHHSKYLQRSYNKYGKSAFEFGTIEYVNDKNDLLLKEQFWIDFYDSWKNGYNVCPYAGNTLGVKCTEENKIRHSIRMAGENNPMYGKTHTKEARQIISKTRFQAVVTPEFREKMSIITSGQNNGMYGKNHSDKTKEIISKKLEQRGGHNGENNPNYGNKWLEETKDKFRQSIAARGGMQGENNPNYGNTKIKKDDWILIFCLVKQKGVKPIVLAKKYNVDVKTIYNVIKRVEGSYV